MTTRSSLFVALVASGGVAVAAAAQQPAPLTPSDFAIAGISDTTDSARVRRLMGRPDSIRVSDHPYDVGAKLIDWWYRDLRVSYNATPTVSSFWLVGKTYRTPRGLSVGDSEARVRHLYGEPTEADVPNEWTYEDPDHSQLVVRVWFSRGRVESVFLGWVID
jgi:hypothetical protein